MKAAFVSNDRVGGNTASRRARSAWTLGSFGSALVDATYEFWIDTTETTKTYVLGTLNDGGNTAQQVGLNENESGAEVEGRVNNYTREEGADELELLVETVDPGQAMLRILVVDDEPSLVEMMARALGGAGHEVDTAADGAAALQHIYTGEYDAILLDIKMPGLGGPEVYQCIESIRPDMAERVLFISGDSASTEVKTFIESTGNPLLKKPFTLDDLRRRMDIFAVAKVERTVVNSGH